MTHIFIDLIYVILDTIWDVLPIVTIIFGFQFVVLRKPIPNLKRILTGFVLVLFGLGFFLEGLQAGLARRVRFSDVTRRFLLESAVSLHLRRLPTLLGGQLILRDGDSHSSHRMIPKNSILAREFEIVLQARRTPSEPRPGAGAGGTRWCAHARLATEDSDTSSAVTCPTVPGR